MPLQPDPLLGIAGPFNGRIFAFGGFGLMLKSEDQGQNWTRVTDATLGDHHLNAMVRAADGALIVVGERGLMARSADNGVSRPAEHTTELQSLMRNSYAVFSLKTRQNSMPISKPQHIINRQHNITYQ